jgi:hypothetical protein
MNWPDLLLSGFLGTAALTTIFSLSKGVGLTRIDLAFLLGTIVTPNRDKAKIIGAAMHFVAGWIFAIGHVMVFQRLHLATWWLGAITGFCHAMLVLAFVVPVLPSIHPRMVTSYRGPEPTGLLEPPGFLALNYGVQTPLVAIAAHIIYGALLGGFYRLA